MEQNIKYEIVRLFMLHRTNPSAQIKNHCARVNRIRFRKKTRTSALKDSIYLDKEHEQTDHKGASVHTG